VHVFPANLSDRDAVSARQEGRSQELEGVDILVNNAGITKDGLFVRMSDDAWDAVLEVNLTSVFRLTRELAHPMMKRRFGRIINITSVVGVSGNPGQANYCASKAGMIGFSKSVAQEIAPRNVTVNCVAPGFIESAMTEKLNDKQKDAIMGAIPMKRMGTGDEIAAVTWLAFPMSPGDDSRQWRHGDDLTIAPGTTIWHVNGGIDAMHFLCPQKPWYGAPLRQERALCEALKNAEIHSFPLTEAKRIKTRELDYPCLCR
jgi:NAD(P)-dependent dehydrogenase (short-subunit alcohol dehydrogenase family)